MKLIKYYLFLTLTAITFSASYGQQAYLLNRPLNGKVKSATFKLTRLKNDDQSIRIIDQSELLIGQYGFDLLHRYEYNPKGNLIYEEGPEWFYHRKYNTAGQLLESITHTNAIANKKVMGKKTYSYLNGKLMVKNDISYITGSECLLQSATHIYNKSGNLTQITTRFFDCDSPKEPKSVQQSHRKYDARLLLTEENRYSSQGALNTTVKYMYDIKKRVVKKSTISYTNSYGATEHYIYDDIETNAPISFVYLT